MRVLSLFTGVGGFDLGLEAAGMTTVFQCEIDKHCQSVLQHRWPDVPRWGDVTTLTGRHILDTAGEVDVVAWGSPCQDLSVAGKRAGLAGERSGLFHEGIRIIKELRELTDGRSPVWSVWENVYGALSSNGGADFGQVLWEMDEAGACFSEWAVLDAQYFGVPQRRRRVFLASCFDSATANRCPSPLFPVAESNPVDTATGGLVAFYKTHGKQDKWKHGIAPPLKAVSSVCVVGEMDRPRQLTPVEHERLMGWPDNHTATGVNGPIADTNRYKMCGNGVASPVARWIGGHLMRCRPNAGVPMLNENAGGNHG